jgi:hypothetical protein|tara:strand:+ start:139 stop:612 length:474 start_codon:yes stop_codon:yes gene_type:complete
MLTHFQEYLTVENIYLWANFGILPFWLMLILIPNSRFTHFFINSIVLPLILSAAYTYIIYQSIMMEEQFINIFSLYLSLENLYALFFTESFLLVFWLHFLSLSIFLGSWISNDGLKYNIPRGIIFIPLILVYFTGPLGLVLYWVIRVFYAKKLGLHG